MVFTKLSAQEKDAFFGLLDEYFQSRPELFGERQGVAGGIAGTGLSTAAATSVVQRALGSASNVAGAGIAGSAKSNNPYAASMTSTNATEADVARSAVAAGRVAAASLAFSAGGGGGGLSLHSQSTKPSSSPVPVPTPSLSAPPSLPRRTTSTSTSSTPAPASLADRVIPGAEVDKLVTKKTSMFSAFKKPDPAESGASIRPIPSAFVAPKNTYGPPPVRRGATETSSAGGAGGGVGATTRGPAAVPEMEGEWAEVLYDYRSEDSGDLEVDAGARVLVTEKSSDDWWSGQVEGQGKSGLFPASYVKLL